MPFEADYVAREVDSALRAEHEVNAAPLADRQDARRAFGEALKNPALIAERISWLFCGNYGFGQMRRAYQVLDSASKRSNVEAQIVHLIAVYEWQCPGAFAIQAWKKLNASEKAALSAAVQAEIVDAVKERSNHVG